MFAEDLPYPYAFVYFSAIPVEEVEEMNEMEERLTCDSCNTIIDGDAHDDGSGAYYCENCADSLIEKWTEEAIAFAEKHCRITAKLPAYDPAREFTCTPEEYEHGNREAYTPNAYLCMCRHDCTNYDELIADLSRDDAEDCVYYAVIRFYIDELLKEHEDYMDYAEEEEDKEEEPD
jgi:hypothetical protein